jgi:hypothetical protein
MMIIRCDYHPSWQQLAWVDTETGECGERKLVHAAGEAKMFYQQLGAPALIGMEATGNSQWFLELVEDLGHAIWIGDATAGWPTLSPAVFQSEAAPPLRFMQGWERYHCRPQLEVMKCR